MGIKGLRTPGDDNEAKLNLSVQFTCSGIFCMFCIRICSRDRPTCGVGCRVLFLVTTAHVIKRHMFSEGIILP